MRANGSPALVQYEPTGETPPAPALRFWALHLLRTARDPSGSEVVEITNVLDPRLPALFGLPDTLPS